MLGKLDKMHREGNLLESSILDKIKALFYLEAARATESKLVKLQRMGPLICMLSILIILRSMPTRWNAVAFYSVVASEN